MKTLIIAIFYSLIFIGKAYTQALEPITLDDQWRQLIYNLAPEKPQATPKKPHKVLLFSLFTGFEHWVIPHVDEVIEILGKKSGVYLTEKSTNISMFEVENLKRYDAIILNNNCSVGEMRNLFYDALTSDSLLSEDERLKMANLLEKNLIDYVKKGGGLAVVHGGIVMQNNSTEFSQMVGGSFDYHPPQQEIEVFPVETDHPITKPFNGKPFVHVDEPYFFKNAYADKNFRPLLAFESSKIKNKREGNIDNIIYIAWVKSYGAGRVFYTSPSHNAQSYENVAILNFYLNGMQYVLGDLDCPDSPLNK